MSNTLLDLGVAFDFAVACCDALERASQKLYSETNDANSLASDLAKTIELIPAKTLEDLAVKARVARWCGVEDDADASTTDRRISACLVREFLAIMEPVN